VTDRTKEHARAKVIAWDVPTRVFHWSVALLILTSWATFRYSEALNDPVLRWHRNSGYAILVLLVWRVLWGFCGSSTSRFGSFLRSPKAVFLYIRDLFAKREPRYLGHNPAGSWVVLILLAAVAAQAVLGLFTPEENDLTAGPLYRLLSESGAEQAASWHSFIFYQVLLVLIALHVAANILYGVVKKQPLISAMLSGRKPAAMYADEHAAIIVPRPLLRALACLLMATALVFVPLALFGGRL
jgi:cytochrome b